MPMPPRQQTGIPNRRPPPLPPSPNLLTTPPPSPPSTPALPPSPSPSSASTSASPPTFTLAPTPTPTPSARQSSANPHPNPSARRPTRQSTYLSLPTLAHRRTSSSSTLPSSPSSDSLASSLSKRPRSAPPLHGRARPGALLASALRVPRPAAPSSRKTRAPPRRERRVAITARLAGRLLLWTLASSAPAANLGALGAWARLGRGRVLRAHIRRGGRVVLRRGGVVEVQVVEDGVDAWFCLDFGEDGKRRAEEWRDALVLVCEDWEGLAAESTAGLVVDEFRRAGEGSVVSSEEDEPRRRVVDDDACVSVLQKLAADYTDASTWVLGCLGACGVSRSGGKRVFACVPLAAAVVQVCCLVLGAISRAAIVGGLDGLDRAREDFHAIAARAVALVMAAAGRGARGAAMFDGLGDVLAEMDDIGAQISATCVEYVLAGGVGEGGVAETVLKRLGVLRYRIGCVQEVGAVGLALSEVSEGDDVSSAGDSFGSASSGGKRVRFGAVKVIE